MSVTHAKVDLDADVADPLHPTQVHPSDWNADHIGTISDAMHGTRATANAHGHADLSGVSANQHHAQSHGHTGADSSGTVAHADTTGKTANDHHAQAHHAAHEPAGGDAMAVDAAAATGSLRTLGSGAAQAAAGNDSRLSDARAPTAHEASHEMGGSDPIADPLAPTSTVTVPSGHSMVVAGTYYITAAAKLVIADTARFAII